MEAIVNLRISGDRNHKMGVSTDESYLNCNQSPENKISGVESNRAHKYWN